MFTSAEVEQVCASPGHLVIERVKDTQRPIEDVCFMPLVCSNKCVAADDLIVTNAAQVDGDPVARANFGALGMQALQRSDANGLLLREHQEFVIDAHPAAGQCAGNDRAGAFRRERSIDPEAGRATVDRSRGDGEHVVERKSQVIDASAVE